MTIDVATRKAGKSTKYRGLHIVTINGFDHQPPEPRAEAEDRKYRVLAAIADMRAAGQSDLQILGKYGSLPSQR